MTDLITLQAFEDNFIYLYSYRPGKAFVIDPGCAKTVEYALAKHNLQPTHILITHQHADHTAGLAQLQKQHKCATIAYQTDQKKQNLSIAGVEIQIIPTPGHSDDSLCYLVTPPGHDAGLLFAGDTLFYAGCGRVFTGNYHQMYQSLRKLAQLPEETIVCPGHDYTEENLLFALSIMPEDPAFKSQLQKFRQSEAAGQAYKSTIGNEKKTNIFLQCSKTEVKAALNMQNAPEADVFTQLRREKDRF